MPKRRKSDLSQYSIAARRKKAARNAEKEERRAADTDRQRASCSAECLTAGISYLYNKRRYVCLFVCLSVCLYLCSVWPAKRLGRSRPNLTRALMSTQGVFLSRSMSRSFMYACGTDRITKNPERCAKATRGERCSNYVRRTGEATLGKRLRNSVRTTGNYSLSNEARAPSSERE